MSMMFSATPLTSAVSSTSAPATTATNAGASTSTTAATGTGSCSGYKGYKGYQPSKAGKLWSAQLQDESIADVANSLSASVNIDTSRQNGLQPRGPEQYLNRLVSDPEIKKQKMEETVEGHLEKLATKEDMGVVIYIRRRLEEKKQFLIENAMKILGRDKCIKLFLKTLDLKSKGGLALTKRPDQQRTKGGIFMFLIKHDTRITPQQRQELEDANRKCDYSPADPEVGKKSVPKAMSKSKEKFKGKKK